VRKFLYLVFNRAAADEAKLKMPSNVKVRTAHSLTFRSVGHVYKSRLAGSCPNQKFHLSRNLSPCMN